MPYQTYILDWKESPQGEPSCDLERPILGNLAEIHYIQASNTAGLPDSIFDADAISLWHNFELDRLFIEKLKQCKVIVRNGVGVDSIDLEAASEQGIPVCNVPDYGTEEVADHALALTLSLIRRILPLDQQARKEDWNLDDHRPYLRRTSSLTFALVGLGRIGSAAALRAKAFGFTVVAYDPIAPAGTEKSLGIQRVDSLRELLSIADVLSIHCPLNENTRHLIAKEELALMKPDAFLVNTARGAIVDQKALVQALKSGKLAGAGLDVVEGEPDLTPDDLSTPNTIITCHAAFCSQEAVEDIRTKSTHTIRDALEGNPLKTRVN